MVPHLLSLVRNSALAVVLLASPSAPALSAPSGMGVMPGLSDNNPNPLVVQVQGRRDGRGGRHMGSWGGHGRQHWRRGGRGHFARGSHRRGFNRGHFARGFDGRGFGRGFHGRDRFYRHAYRGDRYFNRGYGKRHYGRYYGGYYNRYPRYSRDYDDTDIFLSFGLPLLGLYGSACGYYNPYCLSYPYSGYSGYYYYPY